MSLLLLTDSYPSLLNLMLAAGYELETRLLELVNKRRGSQIFTALFKKGVDNLMKRAGQRVGLFILLVFGRAQLRPNSPRMSSGCGDFHRVKEANPNEHVGLKKNLEALEEKSFTLKGKREKSQRGGSEGQPDELCCSLSRRGLGIEPRVAETLSSSGPLLRDELQHGQQEICEASSLLLRPLILLHQNLQKAPRLQLGDVFQVTCGDTVQGSHGPKPHGELQHRLINNWLGLANTAFK